MIKFLMLSLVFTLLANQVFGFKKGDLDKLLATGKCNKCDLTGLMLVTVARNESEKYKGSPVVNINLTEASLEFANLQRIQALQLNICLLYTSDAADE